LNWDADGRPQSAHMILQWQGGERKIVLPEAVAEADLIFPKPEW
jgi:branched-chain amino acid transport system substrate-binding protein